MMMSKRPAGDVRQLIVSPEVKPMFQYHPALVKALQQDRYYRLLNERRRCTTCDPATRNVRPVQAPR